MHAGKALISFHSRVPVAIKRSPRRWGRRNPPIGAVPKISGGNEPSKENSSLQSLTDSPVASTIDGYRAGRPLSAGPSTASRAARESREERSRRTSEMSQFWHKIGCCVVAKPPPKKKRRRKIDRSMIGEPMNFMHLTHIGSGEMTEGLPPSGSVQEQMRSKGPRPWTNPRSPFDLLANPDTLCP
ncbi:hypothetical protein JZ751_007242 [Albula glossodonta]|uniref:CRIB domain-containing protein n=1 Tax=Albula glossodonta TaxID=121402 RepID=A0A8T2NE05_9TELE|nr:hypothetical protein JZ751_007242 [Albula glossodonta]